MPDLPAPSANNTWRRIGSLGMSLAAATVRSVSAEFTTPEFARCEPCGRRIARFSDQKKWHHHIAGIDLDHVATPEAPR